METVDTAARLASLRKLMQERQLDVYIVPSEDNHQSEYVAPCDARREFISGFTGSAGTAVITLDKAALSTDGRYFNQASKQLSKDWTLLRNGMENVPTWQEWTADEAENKKSVVGIDPLVICGSEAKRLEETIHKKSRTAELRGVSENLIDLVWGQDRPSRPANKVNVLDEKYTGKSFQEKIEEIRKELEKKKKQGLILSMLDEIAWLFNLRGGDIPYNPVFFSYAVITPTEARLYIDDAKLTSEAKAYLGDAVQIKPYDGLLSDIKEYADQELAKGDAVATEAQYLVPSKGSWALNLSLKDLAEEIRSPVGDAKAIKTDAELDGMRNCHVRDGAALSEYFSWLEEQLRKGVKLDEVEAADKLEQIRSKGENFVGLSFVTISSAGANAAVMHYSPERGNCATLDPKTIYLCDSGAQYTDGTTDTTRTLHFGEPTEMEIKAYTLVLKGVIALNQAIFPKGVPGFALDATARQFLWKEGLDYRHGTGHGVGSYLNVHEGPIGIGLRPAYGEVALSVGNVLSNEPGYYEDGSFGIRIENMMICKAVETAHKFGDKPWLGFENVTVVPMCRKLIDVKLLTEVEIKYLNDFHHTVWEKTSGYFDEKTEDGARTLNWLKRECAEI